MLDLWQAPPIMLWRGNLIAFATCFTGTTEGRQILFGTEGCHCMVCRGPPEKLRFMLVLDFIGEIWLIFFNDFSATASLLFIFVAKVTAANQTEIGQNHWPRLGAKLEAPQKSN